MAQNYVLLDRIELNASAASVTFSNIPQTGYTDLKIVMSARGDAAYVNGGCFMQINSVTSGYSTKDLYGDGSSAASSSNPYGVTSKSFVGAIDNSGATASTFGNKEIYIPNYTSSNQKSISIDSVIETNGTTAYAELLASLCTTTAAITSLTFTIDSGNFVSGSTFSLYGVAAYGTTPTVAPKADGGNVIATDGTYWYHAFLSNGTFTPQVGLSADVLVVAGGGGGGTFGGGGAGGLLAFTSQSLNNATNYTCTVGAGGPSATTGSGLQGTNGVDSQFGALTLVKGGGGGGAYSDTLKAGLAGGSGGGGAIGPSLGTPGAGGAATSGQGYAGATGFTDDTAASGGGGAGAVGVVGTAFNGGAGGAGVNTYSSWLSATALGVSGFIAGGGGGSGSTSGGSGGSGGGATGARSSGVATTAVINTGAGGGGCFASYAGSAGASGIIIIRYPIA